MEITRYLLTDHKEEILKMFQKNEEIRIYNDELSKQGLSQGEFDEQKKVEKTIDDIIEDIDDEAAKVFEKHKEEIELSLQKNHARTYYAGSSDMNFWGVFHSGSDKQLLNIINKNTKDGLVQGFKVCQYLACNLDELETISTKKRIVEIQKDKLSKTPHGFFLSLSQVLIKSEGIGLDTK